MYIYQVEVPAELQTGARFDKWVEEKDSVDLEADVLFR